MTSEDRSLTPPETDAIEDTREREPRPPAPPAPPQHMEAIVKHTPGPWKIDDDKDCTLTIVAPWSADVKPASAVGYGDYLGIHIAKIDHQNDNACVSKNQAIANAALIAAAPDLLVACRMARDWFAKNTKVDHTPGPVEAALIDAVLKAEARS